MSMKLFAGNCVELRRFGIRLRALDRSRIKLPDIAVLRSIECDSRLAVPLTVRLGAMVENTLSGFAGAVHLFEFKTACKRYGHAINHDVWTELYPTCFDCGNKIRTLAEVRSSLPKRQQ